MVSNAACISMGWPAIDAVLSTAPVSAAAEVAAEVAVVGAGRSSGEPLQIETTGGGAAPAHIAAALRGLNEARKAVANSERRVRTIDADLRTCGLPVSAAPVREVVEDDAERSPTAVRLAEHGLARGALHEWCGVAPADEEETAASGTGTGKGWMPPVGMLAHLGTRVLEATPRGALVWVGRDLWPDPAALPVAAANLMARSLFIDPPDDAARWWAIECALACPAIAGVIADGRRASMVQTRRLQLAAERRGGVVLLARPPAALRTPSAATTRWALQRCTNDDSRPGWTVTLVRCKGRQRYIGTDRATHGLMSWSVMWAFSGVGMEVEGAKGSVGLSAELADGSRPAAQAATANDVSKLQVPVIAGGDGRGATVVVGEHTVRRAS